MIRCAGVSDVGQKRSANEDRWSCVPEAGFGILADGMGGKMFGEVASQMAVDIITKHVREDLPKSCHRLDRFAQSCMAVNLLDEWIRDANGQIYRQGPHAGGILRRHGHDARLRPRARTPDGDGARRRQPLLPPSQRNAQAAHGRPLAGGVAGEGGPALREGGARGRAQEHHHARDRNLGAREARRGHGASRGPRSLPPLLGRPHRHGPRRRPPEAARGATRRSRTGRASLVALANDRGGRDNITAVLVEYRAAS